MDEHVMNKPLSPDDAFDISLLVTCEITKNLLAERHSGHEKRRYYLDRMDKDIEGLNRTYSGYLPDSFQAKAEKFYRRVEADLNALLKDYHADLKQDAKRGGQL